MADCRRDSVYQALGGGSVADVLLWKKWCASATVLVGSTTLWYLFEHGGYNFLTFIANVLLLLVSILFLWAKSAALLNRPLPPVPDLEVSDESVVKAAAVIRVWTNNVLTIAHEIAMGRNLILCGQVGVGLWIVSCIGSVFDFLTLIYIGIIISLSVPIVYDKFQDQIDSKLFTFRDAVQTQYREIDEQVFQRIARLIRNAKNS